MATRLRHRLLSAAALTAAGALLVTGCAQSQRDGGGSGGSGGGDAAQVDGSFIFAASSDPKTLDPAFASDGETFRVSRQIFEGLVGTKPGTADPAPLLAESWESSEDGLTHTFQLKEGVTFHDGEPFNGEAVCANFDRWYNFTGIQQSETLSYYYGKLFRGFADKPEDAVYKECEATGEHERARAQEPHTGVFRVIRRHARLLLTQGLGVTVISALRSARLAILPLWALHIGLDGVDSSQIFAVAGLAELVLVYPGGWVMDRLGRMWVVGALLGVVSLSFVALPLADTKGELLAVALAMALGNGLGSGIVMTLGADAAPSRDRAQFLGAWRLTGEVGHAGGSLGLSAVTSLVSLPAAAVALGGLGLVGLAWTSLWIPRADRERSAA